MGGSKISQCYHRPPGADIMPIDASWWKDERYLVIGGEDGSPRHKKNVQRLKISDRMEKDCQDWKIHIFSSSNLRIF